MRTGGQTQNSSLDHRENIPGHVEGRSSPTQRDALFTGKSVLSRSTKTHQGSSQQPHRRNRQTPCCAEGPRAECDSIDAKFRTGVTPGGGGGEKKKKASREIYTWEKIARKGHKALLQRERGQECSRS